MASSAKAVVREDIFYGEGGVCEKAVCGEYDVDNHSDSVKLCKCNGEKTFRLSMDAFIQHLNEGRIAFVA